MPCRAMQCNAYVLACSKTPERNFPGVSGGPAGGGAKAPHGVGGGEGSSLRKTSTQVVSCFPPVATLIAIHIHIHTIYTV